MTCTFLPDGTITKKKQKRCYNTKQDIINISLKSDINVEFTYVNNGPK